MEALMIDSHQGQVSPSAMREELEGAIEKSNPDSETWGTSERAIRGMAAAESMFGPSGGAP